MIYDITEVQKHNILEFLNRVEYKGLQEVQAISEILFVMNNPVIEVEEFQTQ